MTRRSAHAFLMALALMCALPSTALAAGESSPDAESSGEEDDDHEAGADNKDSGEADEDTGESEPEASDASGDEADADDAPKSPQARLQLATEAYGNGQYQKLSALLEPTLTPDSKFDSVELEIQARQLYAVGLFFQAQQTTKNSERRDLLDDAEQQFLAILRHDPDYELDPLNYPASVVEVFETVREEHEEELAQIRREKGGDNGEVATQTFYVERARTQRLFLVNFLPFGLGQFQNEHKVAGTAFAVGQASMLALNGVAYVGVQLADRNGDGLYNRAGPGSEFDVARQWRAVQWIALGTFSAIYVGSVIDAIVRYEPEKIRIRSLDEPPPELSLTPTEPLRPQVRIGIGTVLLRW
ncbi:MAG: hypothetical protein ACQEVA_04640 [Myxococcota bacterium]